MKGILNKTKQGWVVNYHFSVNKNDWETLPLHPDSIESFNLWDGMEIEFEVVTEWETGEVGVNGLTYAKLITPNKLDLNKIESKIDEALANETPEKLLGWMWKDIEKEDSMNFICQDPDCPHCIEEINQMRDDDDLEDDVERFIKQQLGLPQYIEISSLGSIMESQYTLALNCYNKAKETLYTEEQVREAIKKGLHIWNWRGGKVTMGGICDEIIQSLKQPK